MILNAKRRRGTISTRNFRASFEINEETLLMVVFYAEREGNSGSTRSTRASSHQGAILSLTLTLTLSLTIMLPRCPLVAFVGEYARSTVEESVVRSYASTDEIKNISEKFVI